VKLDGNAAQRYLPKMILNLYNQWKLGNSAAAQPAPAAPRSAPTATMPAPPQPRPPPGHPAATDRWADNDPRWDSMNLSEALRAAGR